MSAARQALLALFCDRSQNLSWSLPGTGVAELAELLDEELASPRTSETPPGACSVSLESSRVGAEQHAGVSPRSDDSTGGVSYVRGEQRAELALLLEPLYEAKANENQSTGGHVGAEMTNRGLPKRTNPAPPINTRAAIAEKAGVSETTIMRVNVVTVCQ